MARRERCFRSPSRTITNRGIFKLKRRQQTSLTPSAEVIRRILTKGKPKFGASQPGQRIRFSRVHHNLHNVTCSGSKFPLIELSSPGSRTNLRISRSEERRVGKEW